MAVLTSTVSVAQTAVALVPARSRAARVGHPRSVILQNSGSNPVFVGGTGVTTSTGISVAAAASLGPIDLNEADTLYAISTTGTNVVKVLQTV